MMNGPASNGPVLADALASSPELELARAALAGSPQATASPWTLALADAGLTAVLRGLAAAVAPAGTTAARHDLPVRVPVDLGLAGLGASAVQATETLGPFAGIAGSFWVDLYGPVAAYAVYGPGDTSPAVVLTAARLPGLVLLGGGSYTVELAGGSVWIRASDLDSGLPSDQYVGFTVAGGSLVFSSAPTVTGERLTSAAPLSATLEVTLGDVAAPAGLCSAIGAVTPPDHLTIKWGGGAPSIDLGPGSAVVAGTSIRFVSFDGTVSEEAELGAVVFGYTLSRKTLDCAPLSTGLVQFAGRPEIAGGWALTLAQPADPDHPGEASGPGFYLLSLQPGVSAQWPGASGPVTLGQAYLTLRAAQLTVGSRHATAVPAVEQTLELYALREDPDAPRLPLGLSFGPGELVFAYVCDSAVGESLHAGCAADLSLDRPVDLNGRPLALGHCVPAQFGLASDGATVTVTVVGIRQGLAGKQGLARRVVALQNALLSVTDPALFALRGTLTGGHDVDLGTLALALGRGPWLPTLPDPYVTNAVPGGARVFELSSSGGLVIAATTWTVPAAPSLGFRGALAAPWAVPAGPPADLAGRPDPQDPGQIQVPTQTEQGSVAQDRFGSRALAYEAAAQADADPQQLHVEALSAMARTSLPWFGSGLRLLDVSTNKDLLGVEIGVADRAAGRDSVLSGGAYQLAGMDVSTAAENLHVIALPQVQWEPVRTLDIDQDIPHLGYFPTPLASATDGGPTRFGVRTARLVPAIPDLAVDATLDEFGQGTSVALLTTLPFGIRALLTLRPDDSADGRTADLIERNEPVFVKPALTGGAQLALTAESGPSGRDDSSYFDGAAFQLANGVSLNTGAPLNISVLGSIVSPVDAVEAIFNDEFGPAGAKPRVPVTRLDISGYGGSTFSDWMHTKAAYAETAKAQFHVVVGRTALEVVKVATVLYPWGIRLTRTVTIERKGGGGVIRRDSGWQANSPGLFDFPQTTPATPGTPYIVEPGLFHGLFNVRNLVPTGGAPVQFTGRNGKDVVLTPKLFDAEASIEGLDGATTVTALGVLGFLQVQPVGEPLHEDDVAQLIAQQGPIGGPADGSVQVGGSGFRIRATRIEVGSSTAASGRPELVGVVRGAPVFHQSGAWSAVRMPGPGNTNRDADAVGVDHVRGLPVVREGVLLSSDGGQMQVAPGTDYRFADPEDLHQPDSPQHEYAFAQTSPAHVFVFPRPHVDAGIAELRSRSTPRFADIYSRMTSKGAFPPAANSIMLPSNALLVGAGGGFRLRDGVDLTGPRPPLTLASNGADVVQLDYSGARLQTSFDPNGWRLDLTGLQLWSDLLGIKRFFGYASELHAGDAVRPVIDNITTLLNSVLTVPLTFLGAFDAPNPLPPVDLSPTNNKNETKVSIEVYKHVELIPKKLQFGYGLKEEMGWERDPASGYETGSGAATFTAEIEGKIPITGILFLLLAAELEAGAKFNLAPQPLPGVTPPAPPEHKPQLQFVLEVKARVGLGIETGVFEGSISVGCDFSIEGSELKVGPLVVLEAEFDIVIAKVGASGEFTGQFHIGDWHKVDWGGELAIHVEIAFCGVTVSVGISEESTV